jgi:hypothetical protein
MSNQFASKRSIIQTGLILVFAVGLSLAILNSCGEIKQPKTPDIADNNKTQILNHDSLVKVIFKFAEPYFHIHTVDSIIALTGKPQRISKIEWGENGMHQDSLVTVKYPLVEFNFLQSPNSYSGLQSFHLLDNKITLAGNMTIGKTTRQETLQSLGLPDSDYNDVGRSLTKDGDTTVYGAQSGVGDIVTFSYHINIDEYAIDFAMTKDTLRRISWVKNMN